MEPKKKVVSRDTAEKLKSLGFPQDTERFFTDSGSLPSSDDIDGGHWHVEVDEGLLIAAPDAQEILEELPLVIEYDGGSNYLYLSVGSRDEYSCGYGDYGDMDYFKSVGVNEAEARAMLWMYLKEEKLI